MSVKGRPYCMLDHMRDPELAFPGVEKEDVTQDWAWSQMPWLTPKRSGEASRWLCAVPRWSKKTFETGHNTHRKGAIDRAGSLIVVGFCMMYGPCMYRR
jgi:hypothetical protein